MSLFSKQDDSGAILMKRGFITIIIVIVFSLATKTAVLHNKEVALKDQYQENICEVLNSIQIKIGTAIENNDRLELRILALSYEELATILTDISSQLSLRSYAGGEWMNISDILLGNISKHKLFQVYDGLLTKEEITFLTQLSAVNEELLLDIADDSTTKGIKNMSISSLEKILDSYHRNQLREFTNPFINFE